MPNPKRLMSEIGKGSACFCRKASFCQKLCLIFDYQPLKSARISLGNGSLPLESSQFESNYSKITRRLNESGFRTRRGNKWQRGTVINLLRNDVYANIYRPSSAIIGGVIRDRPDS